MRTGLLAAAGLSVVIGLGGCGGSSGASVTAPQLLAKAKTTLDATGAVHFTLTSSGVTGSSLALTGGDGDIVRNPVSIKGTFELREDGLQVSVKVASVGSVFEAELPFTSNYVKTDPSKFGLANPAELLDPNNGLSSLLADAQNPTKTGSTRVNGELLDTVTFTVPGNSVPVIPDEAPSQPVNLTVEINPSSYQLRVVTLVGPFTSKTSNSTYTVTLTDYGEQVSITLPSTS